jgi:hypothetical protein
MYPVPTTPTRTSVDGSGDGTPGAGHGTDEADNTVLIVMSALAVIRMSPWASMPSGWGALAALPGHVSRGALVTFLP